MQQLQNYLRKTEFLFCPLESLHNVLFVLPKAGAASSPIGRRLEISKGRRTHCWQREQRGCRCTAGT